MRDPYCYALLSENACNSVAFSMFYTLIKHGFLTNQSARRVLSILLVIVHTKSAPLLFYPSTQGYKILIKIPLR